MSHTPGGARQRYTWIIWSGFALFALNALAFMYYTTAPQVRADVWRHLQEVVIPFLEGRESLSVLWTNHHPSPLLHLLQITNLKLFNLRLDLDAYLGFIFQFLTAGLLLVRILGTTHRPGRGRVWPETLAGLLIVALYFGFNITEQYSWPLLTTVQYLYFFTVALYLSIDRCVASQSPGARATVAGISLIFMFANADFGSLFIASAVAILLLVFVLERRATYLQTALIVIAAWGTYQALLWYIDPNPHRPPNDPFAAVGRVLEQPLRAVVQYSVAMSWGLIDTHTLRTRSPAFESLIVYTSPLLTVAMLGTFVTYCLRKCYRRSLVPLILMLAPALFAASLFIYRDWVTFGDIWGLAKMRYVPTWKFAIVGMLWALWILATEREAVAGKAARQPLATMAGLLMAALLLVQIWQIHMGWTEKAERKRNGNNNDALGIYLLAETGENNFTPNVGLHGHIGPWMFQETLEYLKQHELNVFSPTYPPSPLLDQHVLSKNAFLASGKTVIELGSPQMGSPTPANTPPEWTLQEDQFTLRNTTRADYYVRVVFKGASNRSPHNSIRFTSSSNGQYRVRIYQGTVVLYFTVNSDDQFSLRTELPTSIDRIEVRQSAANS